MFSNQQVDFRTLLKRLDQDSQAILCLPHDPEYLELIARFCDNACKPAGAVFLPTTAQDVATAVKFVTEHNIDMAVVCGGHSGTGASSSDGGLVIDLRRMKTVTIDQEKKTVTCGGGCLWKDVDLAAAEYGLACVGGTVNHTGIGGLTLGGGYGYLSGQHGLTLDNLLAVEMVLASGEIVNVSNEENQELFWAIRGAGANFGIAAKFTYQGHDQKNKICMGPIMFAPIPSVISGILDFFNNYFGSDRDDGKATALLAIACAPPDFKNPIVIVAAFYNGSQEEGNKFYQPILDLNPIMNLMVERPYEEANGILAAMALHGDRKLSKAVTFTLPLQVSTFMNTFDALKDLVDTYIAEDPKIGKSLMLFDFVSHKKINQFNNGCFGNRGNHYNGSLHTMWSVKENDQDMVNWIQRVGKEIIMNNGGIRKDGREPSYSNYDDFKTSAKDCFGEENYARLIQLKAKYDPTNLFSKWFSLVPKKSIN